MLLQQRRNLCFVGATPVDDRDRRGQVRHRRGMSLPVVGRRRQMSRFVRYLAGRNQRELVASTGNGADGVGAEQLSNRRGLHLKVVLLDDDAWPDQVEQLVLRDHVVTMIEQDEQQIQGSRADLDRLVVDQDQSFLAADLDSAKAKDVPHRSFSPLQCRRGVAPTRTVYGGLRIVKDFSALQADSERTDETDTARAMAALTPIFRYYQRPTCKEHKMQPTLRSAGAASATHAAPGALMNRAAVPSATKKAAQGLFALDANTTIVANGKTTTAGTLQAALRAALVAKAGPPKTVKTSVRRIDSPRRAAGPGGPQPLGVLVSFGGVGGGQVGEVISAAPRDLGSVHLSATERTSTGSQFTLATMHCVDHRPPAISEISGQLKPGGKVVVNGQCFGDRAGRVEIIGLFTSGKLDPAFTSWDMTGIEVQIPADFLGIADTVVAVSVVTADGKATPATQAKFFAAREQVEVQPALWSPQAKHKNAGTTEDNPGPFNAASPVTRPPGKPHAPVSNPCSTSFFLEST
ncbi:MAG: hypothetical protein ABI330_10835 [Caldimonas sp.]